MKVEYRIYLGVGIFVAVVMVIYLFTSKEYGGATMLFGTAGLGIMPALYMGWWKRRMDPRPEDNEGATLASARGAVGAFPSHTIWPFVLGMGVFVTAISLVFGAWFFVIGGSLVVFAVTSVTLESRRGGLV